MGCVLIREGFAAAIAATERPDGCSYRSEIAPLVSGLDCKRRRLLRHSAFNCTSARAQARARQPLRSKVATDRRRRRARERETRCVRSVPPRAHTHARGNLCVQVVDGRIASLVAALALGYGPRQGSARRRLLVLRGSCLTTGSTAGRSGPSTAVSGGKRVCIYSARPRGSRRPLDEHSLRRSGARHFRFLA